MTSHVAKKISWTKYLHFCSTDISIKIFFVAFHPIFFAEIGFCPFLSISLTHTHAHKHPQTHTNTHKLIICLNFYMSFSLTPSLILKQRTHTIRNILSHILTVCLSSLYLDSSIWRKNSKPTTFYLMIRWKKKPTKWLNENIFFCT